MLCHCISFIIVNNSELRLQYFQVKCTPYSLSENFKYRCTEIFSLLYYKEKVKCYFKQKAYHNDTFSFDRFAFLCRVLSSVLIWIKLPLTSKASYAHLGIAFLVLFLNFYPIFWYHIKLFSHFHQIWILLFAASNLIIEDIQKSSNRWKMYSQAHFFNIQNPLVDTLEISQKGIYTTI